MEKFHLLYQEIGKFKAQTYHYANIEKFEIILLISSETMCKLKIEFMDSVMFHLHFNYEKSTILGYRYFVVSEKLNDNGFEILLKFI